VIPAKAATESKIRLLLADRQQESLTVCTDGFRVYEPLEEDDASTREYVVHGDGEYVDGDVHVNTCESHASLARRWRYIEASLKTDSHRISERFSSAVKCSANRVKKPSKPSSELCCDSPTVYDIRMLTKYPPTARTGKD
jgi:transposase-like protein